MSSEKNALSGAPFDNAIVLGDADRQDDDLAMVAAKVELENGVSPRESRARIKADIEERYTAPA